MPVEYIEFEAARASKGLRMVVVNGIPSPWGEAAKYIFHVKRIPWKAVRLDARNPALVDWMKTTSGPVGMFDDDAPRACWVQILLLAEQPQPSPSLLPAEPLERARAFGLAHEICGEQGLTWERRADFASWSRSIWRANTAMSPAKRLTIPLA